MNERAVLKGAGRAGIPSPVDTAPVIDESRLGDQDVLIEGAYGEITDVRKTVEDRDAAMAARLDDLATYLGIEEGDGEDESESADNDSGGALTQLLIAGSFVVAVAVLFIYLVRNRPDILSTLSTKIHSAVAPSGAVIPATAATPSERRYMS